MSHDAAEARCPCWLSFPTGETVWPGRVSQYSTMLAYGSRDVVNVNPPFLPFFCSFYVSVVQRCASASSLGSGIFTKVSCLCQFPTRVLLHRVLLANSIRPSSLLKQRKSLFLDERLESVKLCALENGIPQTGQGRAAF